MKNNSLLQKIISLLKPWAFPIGLIFVLLIILFVISLPGSSNTPAEVISNQYDTITGEKKLNSKYNFLVENTLIDGTKVLNVPTNNIDNPFFNDLNSTVNPLEIFKINKDQWRQTFLHSPKDGLTVVKSGVVQLHSIIYQSQTYWLYIQKGNVYVSKPNFEEEKLVNSSQYGLFEKIYSSGLQNELFLEYNTAGFRSKILFKTTDVDGQFVQKTTFGDKIIKDTVATTDDKMLSKPPLPVIINGSADLQNADYFYMGGGDFLVKTSSFAQRFWRWNVYTNKLNLLAEFAVNTAGENNTSVHCASSLETCFIYNYQKNELYSYSKSQFEPGKLMKQNSLLKDTIKLEDLETLFKMVSYNTNALLHYNEEESALMVVSTPDEKVIWKK